MNEQEIDKVKGWGGMYYSIVKCTNSQTNETTYKAIAKAHDGREMYRIPVKELADLSKVMEYARKKVA
jgi:hypothetical protein